MSSDPSRYDMAAVAADSTDLVDALVRALRTGEQPDRPTPFIASGGKGGDEDDDTPKFGMAGTAGVSRF